MGRRFLTAFTKGIGIIALMLIVSCSKKHAQSLPEKMVYTHADSLQIRVDSLLRVSKPVMGYRFTVLGDFDGDKITDTLQEHYTDSLYTKELPKYYEAIDTTAEFEYTDVSFLNYHLGCQSFIEWKAKDLHIPGGQLGFHYIENCGDVNNDGKDELMLVNQWDDFSNCNTAYFYTYANGEWQEIYTTPIWEWQFPPTPSGSMLPGLFGNFGFGTTNDAADNTALEAQLKAFRFVTYYPDHSVEFTGRNAIGVWENDETSRELEEIGDTAYLKKYFKRAVLNDSVYFGRKDNPAIFYKAVLTSYYEKGETIEMIPLDDPASGVTTRIFINNAQSPFRRNNKPK